MPASTTMMPETTPDTTMRSARESRDQGHTRQSSVTRPTKASEIRSVRNKEDVLPSSILARQTSLRIPSNTSSNYTPSKPPEYRASHVKTSSRTSNDITRKPRSIDKSSSMYDMTSLDTPSTQSKGSIYVSKQSNSSNSLSSRTSPRRLGLGARTISPVELQRSKRNSRLLSQDLSNAALPSHMNGARKVSGIPSPVKPPLMSRSRPSPIPPVPALPDRLDDLKLKPVVPIKGREAARSFSGSSGGPRLRSATLAASARHDELKLSSEEKTSFTSPMKQSKPMTNSKNSTTDKQLQPLTLPPLKVQNLSTPTIRKVNNMSQRLRGKDKSTTSLDQQPSASSDFGTASVASDSNHETQFASASVPEAIGPTTGDEKSKEVTGFFGRLTLSRSSSRSKLKKKQSSEQIPDLPDAATTPQVTPEKRRRLSLSWMKGKMSPFNSSSSVPKIDSGIPPCIPKSFTSESLASQLSQVSANENNADHVSSLHDDTRPTSTPGTTNTTTESSTSSPDVSSSEIADEEMRKMLITTKGSKYLENAQRKARDLDAKAVPRQPVDAANVDSLGDCPLNLYEKGEVIDYDGKVYFTGQKGLAKIGGRLDSTLNINFGYDDSRGDYLFNPGDHFAYRYEIIDVLGKGSFGQVLRCIDYKTGGLVAIKVIRNKQRFHAQALVEVKILKMLRTWDPADKHHLIKYTDHFHFRNHLCIATDLLGMNLYEYVKANEFKGCTLNIIRSFTHQILTCLLLLKRERVIHCDLKPENILLVNIWESKIKIIDFGSSCFEDQKVYTYIQSRFYRSPEVILGMTYGLPIDIWSMGCILAELFTGFPIFPGEDEQEQLACIMEIFGPPEKHLIENSTRKKLFFDSLGKPRSIVSSKGRRRKPSSKTLAQATKCNDEAFLDFLTRCLRWNPETRLTPEEALNHPFITRSSTLHMSLETPRRPKKFMMGNQIPTLGPRPLPKTPASQYTKIRAGASAYRSSSTAVSSLTSVPTLGSPSKSHRRVISNLPLPRERVIT